MCEEDEVEAVLEAPLKKQVVPTTTFTGDLEFGSVHIPVRVCNMAVELTQKSSRPRRSLARRQRRLVLLRNTCRLEVRTRRQLA